MRDDFLEGQRVVERGLTALLLGSLAHRYRLHRCLLTGGLTVTAVGLTALPFVDVPIAWLGLAFLLGLGVAAASTVANLFVVEAHPEDQWDGRIAWLQTFQDSGYVGGLLLAVWWNQIDLRFGLLIITSITGLAAVLGWTTTQTPPTPSMQRPVLLHPARYGELAQHTPQHLYHHTGYQVLWRLAAMLRSSFGRFLVTWLLSLSGSSAFFAFYPVLARNVFGISSALASLAFALAASLRLMLYVPAGRWSHRCSPVLLASPRQVAGSQDSGDITRFRVGRGGDNPGTLLVSDHPAREGIQ
jgi:hypothetical protein